MTDSSFIILGASGFIGQHLAKTFANHGVPVSCYARTPVINQFSGITYHTIARYADLDPPSHATVYHLAETHHIREVEEYGKKYIEEVSTFAKDLLAKNIKRLIYTSSTAVYNDTQSVPSSPDSEWLNPKTIYAQAKLAVEKIVLEHHGTVARLTNTYGSGMSNLNIFADILGQLNQKKIILREATPIRDYIYIDDLVEGLFRLGMVDISGIYNLGSGVSHSCEQLCKIFLNLTDNTNKTVEYLNPPRRSRIYLDISKTIITLGWKPHYNLESGIRKLLETIHD